MIAIKNKQMEASAMRTRCNNMRRLSNTAVTKHMRRLSNTAVTKHMRRLSNTAITKHMRRLSKTTRCDIMVLQHTSMTDVDDDDDQYRADREAALMTTTISTAATMWR